LRDFFIKKGNKMINLKWLHPEYVCIFAIFLWIPTAIQLYNGELGASKYMGIVALILGSIAMFYIFLYARKERLKEMNNLT
jgi:membrane protease YdiL (CAAX protease family)